MLLQLSGLNLKRGVKILENVHWSVQSGQNWVILGSNGSGKTSLINVILGFEQPTSGKFMVFDQPFGSVPWENVRRQIGVLSHSISQRIEADQAVENVVVSGKTAQINTWNYITQREKEEARRWLYLVGAEHLSERRWGVISQGERQRVMIARALILQPKLLILDEPCAGLDPVARESFLQFLQHTLTEEFEIPTVLITHHVEEILPMFSHVLLMKSGGVLDCGKKEKVLTSDKLSQTFNTKVEVQSRSNRFTLSIVK